MKCLCAQTVYYPPFKSSHMKYTDPDIFILLDYINWEKIVENYELKHGDLTLEQEIKLGNLILEFINQNK